MAGPRRARSRLVALGATAAMLAMMAAIQAGCGGSSNPTRPTAPVVPARRYAALNVLNPPLPPADFTLRDSLGHRIDMSRYRGKAVFLTFIYTHCPDTCPLIISKLRSALLALGPRAKEVQIVAVSVDPRGDTPRAIRAFLAARGMTGRMEYLVGSLRELTPVWKLYGIGVQQSPNTREVGHSAFVYGLGASGKRIALYPAELQPAWVVHDAPILATQ